MSDLSGGFTFVANHGHLIWGKLGTTVILCVEALIVALLISIPLGIVVGHLHRLSWLAINTSNVGRGLPSLAVLAILLPFIGIGRTDVIIALVVLAVPPMLTNTYVAVDQVDPDTVDAAKGIGMRPLQVIARVELPLALPLIFLGIRTSAVFVVATATLAGYFGGGGLGDIIANQASYKLSGVIGAAYVLIVLAFVSQLLFYAVEKVVTPAGLRTRRRERDAADDAIELAGTPA